MVQLKRTELRRLLALTDELLDVRGPGELGPVLLSGVCRVLGGDSSTWHEVDVGPPVREVATSWPAGWLSLDLAERAAPVIGTHPLLEVQRGFLQRGVVPPRLGRLSAYASRRRWHATPLYREALNDVDDQLVLITAARGTTVQFVSVERRGRAFTDRDQDVLATVARHVRAAASRASAAPLRVLQTTPQPAWTLLDPRPAPAVPPRARPAALSTRQREVLALVAEGLTDSQIA